MLNDGFFLLEMCLFLWEGCGDGGFSVDWMDDLYLVQGAKKEGGGFWGMMMTLFSTSFFLCFLFLLLFGVMIIVIHWHRGVCLIILFLLNVFIIFIVLSRWMIT